MRNGHVMSKESDTQYLLYIDLHVGGLWVKALMKSPRASVGGLGDGQIILVGTLLSV